MNARRRHLSVGKPGRATANLAAALRQGDIEKVREILRAGAQPHWSWVCETMREGRIAFAAMLIEFGLDRNIYTMAAMGDSAGIRRRLSRVPADAVLTSNMEPSSENVTALHVACSADWRSHGLDRMTAQVETVDVLIENGADLNASARYRGIEDATPLLCACWSSGNLALVQRLLELGAITSDACLWAALGHLQHHGRGAYDLAETLLASGLSIDSAMTGRTLLQAFAHHGDRKAVAWLISHGADVGVHGIGGRTAAHFAAERNTGPSTLSLLVEAGADLAALDDDGKTPFDIAILNEKHRIVEWILGR